MLARDDERMPARGRVDVHEGDRALVLVRRAWRGSPRRRSCRTGSRGRRTCAAAYPAAWPSVRMPPSTADRRRCAPPSSPRARSTGRRPRTGSGVAAEWIRGAAADGRRRRADRGGARPRHLLGAARADDGAAGLAGLAARAAAARARALAGGAAAAAGIADDVSGGPHRGSAALLPASHDLQRRRRGGRPRRRPHARVRRPPRRRARRLVFAPQLPRSPADPFPGWYDRQDTLAAADAARSPAGPALVALGALTGSRRCAGGAVPLARLRAAVGGHRPRSVVPGANDNLSGVAVLLELARRCASEPRRRRARDAPLDGSEESFMEGMRGFGRRHFARCRASAPRSSASTPSARRT